LTDLDADIDLDLTPREPTRTPVEARRRRSYRNVVILTGLALVLGFVLYQALASARVYYLNVDEAVARHDELARQNFRMQGEVIATDGTDTGGALLFTMAFADATAKVRHVGDEPSDLFGVGQKVVVNGYWDGQTFRSDQILLKHSEQYIEDNPDRLNYTTVTTTASPAPGLSGPGVTAGP
jgi:cytochrome c-type biogenesis protein CcmE